VSVVDTRKSSKGRRIDARRAPGTSLEMEGPAPGHGLSSMSIDINMIKTPEYIHEPFLYNLTAGMA